LKIIYNLIPYSKIKKIVIKSIMTKCEEKNNWRGCSEILQELTQNLRRRKKKKKRNDRRCQTSSDYDTHDSPLCRGFRDFPNTALQRWSLVAGQLHMCYLNYVGATWGLSACWSVPVSFFKIILNILLLQC
jgi:hypothetical protein